MIIELGEAGTDLTWQTEFPKITKCCKCGKSSRLAFVAKEDREDDYVCHLHKNDPKGEGFWLHDAAAFAVYLCTDIECAEGTVLWNQG
jgi:hypothetical protein